MLGLVGALWGVSDMTRRRLSGGLRPYLYLTEALISLEALLGIALVATGARPADGLHFLYGPAVFLSLPVAFSLAVGTSGRREAVTLCAGSAAVFLLSLRALTTGGV